jgi:hypothetical protein
MSGLNSNKSSIFLNAFIIAISVIWLASGVFFMICDFKNKYRLYDVPLVFPPEYERAAFAEQDFYQFLKFCDKKIPEGKDVRWELSEDKFLRKDVHFSKAYYYLYPRNYRVDADYIIVYGKKGYSAPSGYTVFAEFGKNAYVFIKSQTLVN